uniref:PDZ domain-containing protein n=1 Tax=Romanomermis culicivorax TaxID=13658 RepID=A0A915JYF3_ROMCU
MHFRFIELFTFLNDMPHFYGPHITCFAFNILAAEDRDVVIVDMSMDKDIIKRGDSSDDSDVEDEDEEETCANISFTAVDYNVSSEMEMIIKEPEFSNLNVVRPEIAVDATILVDGSRKWKKRLEKDVEIILARVDKDLGDGSLGIALEGTVDVVNGTELWPHHYVQCIVPNGPAHLDGRLKCGDELLEANRVELYGKSYLEVVRILRELPPVIHLLCARRLPPCPKASLYEPSTCDLLESYGLPTIPDRIIKEYGHASIFGYHA